MRSLSFLLTAGLMVFSLSANAEPQANKSTSDEFNILLTDFSGWELFKYSASNGLQEMMVTCAAMNKSALDIKVAASKEPIKEEETRYFKEGFMLAELAFKMYGQNAEAKARVLAEMDEQMALIGSTLAKAAVNDEIEDKMAYTAKLVREGVARCRNYKSIIDDIGR
ncbi:hypothetical protein BM525_20630 (plasmid) [Alteromonas mediterranea]|uniref:DUF5667 domain-containing protein n=1 Tax=Alteromonas mediterranea TaxID=314275 RepID=A0AAC9JF86_9ALTE|nr:hypothetical protein [Alteromonas mediterranea]APD92271.1 hypothetical protein BM524_20405 [Alteromonas mediterranea]APE00132.1 hypothetical protein BM525_20630 [Alteromonas mediterranea]